MFSSAVNTDVLNGNTNILSFDPCTITNYEAFDTLFTTPKNWVAYYMLNQTF